MELRPPVPTTAPAAAPSQPSARKRRSAARLVDYQGRKVLQARAVACLMLQLGAAVRLQRMVRGRLARRWLAAQVALKAVAPALVAIEEEVELRSAAVADAAAAAAAARLLLAAESGGGDAKRRVDFDAPASEAKRRGKEKGPRSKAKRKAADAEPTVVVDAEQEAPRLRGGARAAYGGDGRATRPPRGHGPRDGLGTGLSQRPVAGCRRYDGSQPALAWVKGVGVRARCTKPAHSLRASSRWGRRSVSVGPRRRCPLG